MHTGFNQAAKPVSSSVGKAGGFDISVQQKIAALNLLMNDKD